MEIPNIWQLILVHKCIMITFSVFLSAFCYWNSQIYGISMIKLSCQPAQQPLFYKPWVTAKGDFRSCKSKFMLPDCSAHHHNVIKSNPAAVDMSNQMSEP